MNKIKYTLKPLDYVAYEITSWEKLTPEVQKKNKWKQNRYALRDKINTAKTYEEI